MINRTFKFASVISLLLFISVIAFWIRSYWVADEFMLKRARYDANAADSERDGDPIWVGTLSEDSILSNRGHFRFYFRHSIEDLELSAENVKEWSENNPPGTQILWSRDDATGGEDHFEFFQVMNEAVYVNRLGFFVGTCQIGGISPFPQYNVHAATCPTWFVAGLTALLPLLRLGNHWRSKRRKPPGTCRVCGYNLTANTSGVCPECGTPVSRESRATA